jgi:AbrB family looped-hinge helix DNA binding protein
MELVTLSSKYQVVIPRSVRVSLGLRPGMKLQVIAYNGRVEFQPVRKPAVSASTQAGRTSRLFKGIGNGHRKGIGSIVNVVDSSAWKIKLAVSVVSCQCRRVEIRNSEWRRKRFTAPSASGQNVYFGLLGVHPGLCFLGHFGPQIGHEPRYPFVTSVTSVRCFPRSPGSRPQAAVSPLAGIATLSLLKN